jgi:lysophospholipase L1-like esterase
MPLVLELSVSMPRNNIVNSGLGWTGSGPRVADHGIDSAATRNVLWQSQAGQLAGTSPFVVLGVGINNLGEDDTPAATAAGVLADVAAIHHAAPQTEVIVVGILPTGPGPQAPPQAEIRQTNALVAQALAGDPRALFADLGGATEQADGAIPSWIRMDDTHPTALGYFDLTWALLPYLERALFASL